MQKALSIIFNKISQFQIENIFKINQTNQKYSYNSFKIANVGKFFTNSEIFELPFENVKTKNNQIHFIILKNGELHVSINNSHFYLLVEGDIQCSFQPFLFCPTQILDFFENNLVNQKEPIEYNFDQNSFSIRFKNVSKNFLKKNFSLKNVKSNYLSILDGFLAFQSKNTPKIQKIKNLNIDESLNNDLILKIDQDLKVNALLINEKETETLELFPENSLKSIKLMNPDIFNSLRAFLDRSSNHQNQDFQLKLGNTLPFPTADLIEIEREFKTKIEKTIGR